MRIQACNNKQNTRQNFGMVSFHLAENHPTISIVNDMPHAVCVGDKFFHSKFASKATKYLDVVTSFVNANISAKRLNPDATPIKTIKLKEFKELLHQLVSHTQSEGEFSADDVNAMRRVIDSADENNIIPINIGIADTHVNGLVLGESVK